MLVLLGGGLAGRLASKPLPVKPLEGSNPPLGTRVDARFLAVVDTEGLTSELEDTEEGGLAGIKTLVAPASALYAYMDDVRGGGDCKTSELGLGRGDGDKVEVRVRDDDGAGAWFLLRTGWSSESDSDSDSSDDVESADHVAGADAPTILTVGCKRFLDSGRGIWSMGCDCECP